MAEALEIHPLDEYNRALVDHVHPSNWVNPTPKSRYDLLVIGGGPAGLVSAAIGAGLGAKVALIEKHLLGGDCLNVGCVPSKALIRAGKAFADVANAGEFGVSIDGDVSVDFGTVMERMRRIRSHLSKHDSAERFSSLGMDVYLGSGAFTSADSFEIDGKTLRFKKACIATGARASAPPVPGLEHIDFLDNESVFELTELPKRLAVIGAGPIGCELAQSFARFGSEVTLIEIAPRILIREDLDAAEIVQNTMKADGVELLLDAKIAKMEQSSNGSGQKTIFVEAAGKQHELTVDHVLIGAGRAPNVDGLGLEEAGVSYDTRKGISVDDNLRTSNPKIFAAGDVASRYQFTHSADALARIVAQNALFKGRKKASALTIPWATYTDPEIAHVGLYEQEAKEQGIKVKTFTQPFAEIDRAQLDGETEGFVRIHVKEGSDKIIGATIVGRHAGDMISQLTTAMVGGVGLGTISNTIHPYPTIAEAIKRVGDAYNRSRLTPFTQKLLKVLIKILNR